MASPTLAFLDERLPSGAGRLAVFGKHPAAADHLEDIGLATASLVGFKQGFYVDGIGECLSRQLWLKDLGTVDAVPYEHGMLCLGAQGWLAARFQQSADAPGRRQFPIVLALHGGDFAALNQVLEIGQILEQQLAAVVGSKDIASLRQVHATAQSRFDELLNSKINSAAPGTVARESWLAAMSLGLEKEGLWRVFHALSAAGAGAGRVRVPLNPASQWQTAVLWASLIRRIFQGKHSIASLVWRQRQPYADLALAPPTARVLSSLFASETSQPLTTTVPFNVSQEFKAVSHSSVQEWLQLNTLFEVKNSAGDHPSLLNKVCNSWREWFKSNR